MKNKNLKQYDDMYLHSLGWWIWKKFLREWHQLLFKFRFKKRKTEHLGLKLTLPFTSWMGKYLVVPNEFFMSKTIHAALIMKQGVAIDIGTHAGEFLIRYKAACKSIGIDNGVYYGFEPNYVSFSFINELIAANKWKGSCNVLPVALADSTKLRTFYASRYADPCGSIHQEINQGTTGFNTIVPTYKADELVEQLEIEKISIIKIDTEGAELDILIGLKNTLEKHRPCIHCELANIPDSVDPTYQYIVDNNRKVIEVMLESDYQSFAIIENGTFYHHPKRFKNYLPYLSGALEISDIPGGGNYVMAHKDDVPELLSLMTKNS